ncbi:MAG: TRAP transporter small permease subunit [Betaproteobacteria bacterium]|nr:TRAP transporter small permease subunit [Betaproteobacteria bacterium]
MSSLLKLSRLIDAMSEIVGKTVIWLILAAVLLSAGNAIVRKAFQTSSNALLEAQWYLFSAVFLLGAGYTFLKNAHVRIDFVSARLSPRVRNLIDIAGIVLFLVPLCYVMASLAWPLFVQAFETGEMSQNAGGLIRWPAYFLLPAGMALLLLQALSELIKRVAFLRGLGPDPLGHGHSHEQEEELARELAAEARKHEQAIAVHDRQAGREDR